MHKVASMGLCGLIWLASPSAWVRAEPPQGSGAEVVSHDGAGQASSTPTSHPAAGLHFTAGVAPYVTALLDIPDASTSWGLLVVGGINYGLSPALDLRVLAVVGGGQSPMRNNDSWFDVGGQVTGRLNWSSWLSSELGLRAGAVALPIRTELPNAAGEPPAWQAYRSKLVGSVGPYLSLLTVRGVHLGEYDTMEVVLWHSLLFTTNAANSQVFETGIALTYLRL